VTLWLDAHLSPALARWIEASYPELTVLAVRDLGLREAEDADIFDAARRADAVVMTKDRDFVELLLRRGPPPKVLWVTAGNTSNAQMQHVLMRTLPDALRLLAQEEALVEIQ
jgi:predicted nuclease of predicted toxin-antitoxin system